MSSIASDHHAVTRIDPRGPRLTAAVTAVILVVILLLSPTAAAVLTAVQLLLFATGALRGVHHTPMSWVFRTYVRPKLSAPTELEDPAPPRFAQAVGLMFTVVALLGYVSGATLLGQVTIGFALIAALLNAVFDFCLGCEVYLLLRRVAPRPA